MKKLATALAYNKSVDLIILNSRIYDTDLDMEINDNYIYPEILDVYVDDNLLVLEDEENREVLISGDLLGFFTTTDNAVIEIQKRETVEEYINNV